MNSFHLSDNRQSLGFMQNILNTGVVFFLSFLFSLWGRSDSEPTSISFFPVLCACVCVFACMCEPLMLMYALGMTLIDLAALLAQYSFFPNLSLSWLLWLLISQLQKPPDAKRFQCTPSSLSPFLSFSCSLSLPLPCCISLFLTLSPSFDRRTSLVDGNLFNTYQGN